MNIKQVNLLLQEGTFPEGDCDIQLIETNISWVIICKKYAYKIKKPVKLSFLDFSSLRNRELYCNEELWLNKRLTQGIYLNVLPIRQFGSNYHISGNRGNIVDYAVQMKKLNPAKEMNFLLKKNKVTKDHIDSIINIVLKFHQNAARIYSGFSIDNIRKQYNDILTIEEFLEGRATIRKINYCIKKSDAFLKKNIKLFLKRQEQGYIRDCHGDMHSKNIFLYKRPVIFDCIEFNEEFRHIDVLKEIAFLCTDLDVYNKHKLSNYFLNSYNGGEPDDQIHNLFIYYKSLCANIRAKIELLKLAQKKKEGFTQAEIDEPVNYINAMYSYSLLL